jgi:hypothetical protein
VSDLPRESERLLAVPPGDFVAERQRLVRELRDAGRPADAEAVAAMRKPSAVVAAVNRAARGRSKAARSAAEAAERVEKAQAKGDLEAFKTAVRALDEALDLLGEVAVAHVAPSGKKPTDAMRRRVHDLLRRAVASKETREALSRGALLEEQEAAGFSALAGVKPKPPTRQRAHRAPRTDARAERRADERRRREAELRGELESAQSELDAAERIAREAEKERSRAERAVARVRAKLDRLA